MMLAMKVKLMTVAVEVWERSHPWHKACKRQNCGGKNSKLERINCVQLCTDMSRLCWLHVSWQGCSPSYNYKMYLPLRSKVLCVRALTSALREDKLGAMFFCLCLYDCFKSLNRAFLVWWCLKSSPNRLPLYDDIFVYYCMYFVLSVICKQQGWSA
jgi:hypothetical protein